MDLDLTLLIQLGIFCLVLVVLNTIVLKPFLQVIEARQGRIQGAREEAEKLTRETTGDVAAYESRIRQARRDALKERDESRHQGREEERRLLAEARAEIARQLNDTREEVGQAELEARSALSAETSRLASQLVEKVLGRKVAA